MPNQRHEANENATFYSRLLLNSLERHRRVIRWNWNRSVAKGKLKPNESHWAHRQAHHVHVNHNAHAWQPNSMLAFGHKIPDTEVSHMGFEWEITSEFIELCASGSSTLPRATSRSVEQETGGRGDKVTAATSSTSLYDNVSAGNQGIYAISKLKQFEWTLKMISLILLVDAISRQTKSQETSTMTTTNSGTITTPLLGSGQNHVGSQICQDDAPSLKQEETSKSEGTQAGGTLQHSNTLASTKSTSTGNGARTKDYSDEMVCKIVIRLYDIGRIY